MTSRRHHLSVSKPEIGLSSLQVSRRSSTHLAEVSPGTKVFPALTSGLSKAEIVMLC